jgi:hypothetical protein
VAEERNHAGTSSGDGWLLSLDFELAKRYLAALVKAVVPVAADKTWNLGIVVGGNAIVVEVVEQGEKPAADARTA